MLKRRPRELSQASETALIENLIDLYRRYHMNRFKRYPKIDRIKIQKMADMVRELSAHPETFIKAQFETLHYLKPRYGLGMNIISSPKSKDRYKKFMSGIETKYTFDDERDKKSNARLLRMDQEIRKQIKESHKFVRDMMKLKALAESDNPEEYVIWSHYHALSLYYLAKHPVFRSLNMDDDLTPEQRKEIAEIRKSKYKVDIIKKELSALGYDEV